MRKVVLGLVAVASGLAIATPASAQYYPRPYGQAYVPADYGQVRALQARVDAVERQIRLLDRRNVVRDDRADRFREDANQIERRLHKAARNGLNPYEANEISARIARLEQRVQYAAANNYGRYRRY